MSARPRRHRDLARQRNVGTGARVRTLRYVASVGNLAATRRADSLVAHMCLVYLVLAAPVTKIARMRTALWFVHPAD